MKQLDIMLSKSVTCSVLNANEFGVRYELIVMVIASAIVICLYGMIMNYIHFNQIIAALIVVSDVC